MRGDRLSALDASFLGFEDGVSHMHIGSIGLFEGPPPSLEELHEMVLAKLPLVPRYRQIVRFVPFGAGRPVWVEDPHFNLEYHLRRSALPAPGDADQLQRLVGRVMSQQLDRTKPLWEMWVVEGVDLPDLDAPWALVSKTHHCMVDGISATDLLSVMLDSDPQGPHPAIDRRRPSRPPHDVELLAGALGAGVEDAARVAGSLMRPWSLAQRGADAASGLLRMRGVLRPPPTSTLNGPLGPTGAGAGRTRSWPT